MNTHRCENAGSLPSSTASATAVILRQAAGKLGRAAMLALLLAIPAGAVPAFAETARNVVTVSDHGFREKVLQANIPVLVDFSAPWCASCRALDESLGELAATRRTRVIGVAALAWGVPGRRAHPARERRASHDGRARSAFGDRVPVLGHGHPWTAGS